MTLDHVLSLSWVRNPKKSSYHSVHHEHEPWFYLIERSSDRRVWTVGRIRFRNKKRAKWQAIPSGPEYCNTLHEAKLIAACDYTSECIPLMEESWLGSK